MKKDKTEIKFFPWVGDNYELGIKSIGKDGVIYGTHEEPGKKILVLGDSHYCAYKKDATENLTQRIFDDFIYSKSEHDPYKATYTKFERFIEGKIINEHDRVWLWNHLVVYNFLQEPMSGPRICPTKIQYTNSTDAFWEVLETYQPDIVIVWGKRLYNNLPKQGEVGVEFNIDGKMDIETWIYKIDEKTVYILPIYHPSGGFSWSFWNTVLVDFFQSLQAG